MLPHGYMDDTHLRPPLMREALVSRFQHILKECSVSSLRIIFQNMGYRAHAFTGLYYGAAVGFSLYRISARATAKTPESSLPTIMGAT